MYPKVEGEGMEVNDEVTQEHSSFLRGNYMTGNKNLQGSGYNPMIILHQDHSPNKSSQKSQMSKKNTDKDGQSQEKSNNPRSGKGFSLEKNVIIEKLCLSSENTGSGGTPKSRKTHDLEKDNEDHIYKFTDFIEAYSFNDKFPIRAACFSPNGNYAAMGLSLIHI